MRSSSKGEPESCRKEKEALGASHGKNLGKRKEGRARGVALQQGQTGQANQPKRGHNRKGTSPRAAAKEEGGIGSWEAGIAGNRESKELYTPPPPLLVQAMPL